MSSTEPVTIRILDREYRIGCEPDEKQGLLAAASHVDQQMREIRDTTKVVGMEKVAVMAALNIAHELLSRGDDHDSTASALGQRIASLTSRLDEALDRTVE